MDVDKLKGLIVERGYAQKDVAQYLGICEKTFYSKMKKGVFGTNEAQRMVDMLKIENPADIFFDAM